MKFIAIVVAVIAALVSAADEKKSLRSNEMKAEEVATRTATFNCPIGSWVGQTNANLGGILDRVNFRCSDPNHSSFGDIGAPLAHVLSPKSNTIQLPDITKGWDTFNVGYSTYVPKGQEVVVSIQLCQKGKCFETGFFYGLTICSADSSSPYKCPRIASFTASSGKYLTGVTATFVPQADTGYVKSIAPVFK
jgi:hypothetical protein